MFDLKDKVDAIVKAVVCAAAAAAAGVAALFFFCVALFVWTEQHYGTVTAALVLAILFLLIVIAALTIGLMSRRQSERVQRRTSRPAAQAWADPMVVAPVLEILRTVGGKRVITLLLGAFLVGSLLARPGDRPTSTGDKT